MQCKCIQSYTHHVTKMVGINSKAVEDSILAIVKNCSSIQVESGMWHFEEEISWLQT